MTMMGWRFMYWAFVSIGLTGVILGAVLLLRAVSRRRPKMLVVASAALVLAGLIGTIVVAAAGPGGFRRNMMGMGGTGMMRNRNDIGPAPRPSPGARGLDVIAQEFSFSPAEFPVKAGVTVNVNLTNAGSVFHTFTITALDFELEENGGQTASGALRIDRPGTYEFICAVAGHAQSGMRGRVIAS